MPCSEKRTRLLLSRCRARVHRMVDRLVEDSTLQPVRLKLAPGSRTSGMALVRESVVLAPHHVGTPWLPVQVPTFWMILSPPLPIPLCAGYTKPGILC